MRWSQLRVSLKDRFAPSLRDRLDVRQARYRRTREEVGRVWVELDGVELISFDTSSYVARRAELERDIRLGVGPFAPPPDSGYSGSVSADHAARDALRRSGEYDDYSALVDLEAYLSLSIDDALQSPSPLVRALAMADRRVGKRRLKSLAPLASEHPFVQTVFAARCKAENLG